MDLKLFIRCLFSPSLYTIHRGHPAHVGKYDPNEWERWGDNLITSFALFRNLTLYTCPLLLFVLSRRGYFSVAGAISIAKISLGLGVIVGASYCIRSYGRTYNKKYKDFLATLDKAEARYNSETQFQVRNYDFDFSAWPIDYEVNSMRRLRGPLAKRSWYSILSPCSLLSYVVLHTFGIRLIYPGSIHFLGYLMASALAQGRNRLVVNESGQRNKVKTSDGNYIDTMFIDNRNNPQKLNGSTLVICSEGNAGFYEIGIMVTPLEGGYSILGWNHPGFGGSSGMPYVEEEQNAIDAVVQFATNKLGFKLQEIVLFGWSIGGYATAFASMHYPDVKAVVVDASFDDLVPLAVPRMPQIVEPIVKQTVRLYANLDIARKLCQYPGPVLIVRRSEDEVISIIPNDLATNRGNHLLLSLLRHRYPNLFSNQTEAALNSWLSLTGSNQAQVYQTYRVNEARCRQIVESYLSVSDATFPYSIGEGLDPDLKTQLLLCLASKYLQDYPSTHCTPLPVTVFKVPDIPLVSQ